MEFPFVAVNVLQCDIDGFCVIDGLNPGKYKKSAYAGVNAHRSSNTFFGGSGASATSPPDEQLDTIIDRMGQASATA